MALEATNPDGSHRTRTDRLMGAVLSVSATAGPTPTAAEGTKIPSAANYGQLGLSNHPAIVGEPTRPKGQKSRRNTSGPPSPGSGPLALTDPSTDGNPRGPLWPTPRTITGGPESAERKQELGRTESGGGDLQSRVNTPTGKLNPAWVEHLMGTPNGWTQLSRKFQKPRKGA